jgi:hypothetical protein
VSLLGTGSELLGSVEMALWRVTANGPVEIPQTKPKKAKLVESDLEDWVVKNPAILGEPLLVIWRQVLIPDIKDRLDVLAVDTAGNAVVIELKRGHLRDPVDVHRPCGMPAISRSGGSTTSSARPATSLGRQGTPTSTSTRYTRRSVLKRASMRRRN